MLLSSRSIAGGFGLALALSAAIADKPLSAQAVTQDTAHKKSTMQMPMKMPMGKKTQKNGAASKTTGTGKAAAARTTAKTNKKSAPVRVAAKKRVAPKSMPMSMGAEPHRPSVKAGPMRMADTVRAMHRDSAHREMGGMKMQPAPAKIDSMKMPGMAGMDMPTKPADSTHAGIPGMKATPSMGPHSADDMMIGPVGVSMERMGSGTTWIPDAVTLPSRRRMFGNWMLMAHGFVFAQYDKQTGERGDDQFGSLNWAMVMATHDFVGGRFQARTMLSLDPLTVTNHGYPLLLQTGETYKGQPLYDRQHPHDFWMELGALYQRELTKGLAWSIYAAPSGEPALGPVAFMHRPSAMDNLAAPLGHHWQDATHVSFGVLTGGIYSRRWQLESSVFNSRDPDEDRWDFDPIRLDSYSGRLSVNPDAHWSIAGGYGFLKSHDALAPDESMHRMTASVLHGARLGAEGQWASSLIWGANKHNTETRWSNAFLLESEAILDEHSTLFGRSELVDKGADDLVVDNPVVTRNGTVLPGFPASQRFNVGALQLGYIRELARTHWATIGLGAAETLNFVPASLEPYYGSRNPIGTFIFLRLRPFHKPRSAVRMNHMGGMQMKNDRE